MTFDCLASGVYNKQFDYLQLYNPKVGTVYYLNQNDGLPRYLMTTEEFAKIKAAEDKVAAEKQAQNDESAKMYEYIRLRGIKEKEQRPKNINKTVDSLRTAYIGKPVWLKTNTLYTYDESTKVYDLIKSSSLIIQAATVISVALSPSPLNIFRITIKTAKGITGYYDFDYEHAIRVREVNDDPINPKQAAEFRTTLPEILFTYNPIIKHNLTPAKIAAIRKGDIYIGMDKISVSLIRGEPDKVNHTTTSSINYEQWVYNDGEYYYFENGKLVTVQN